MYASSDGYAGYQSPNDWFVPDTTQRHTLGLMIDFVDPFWGTGTLVYGKSSGAIAMGLVCIFDELYNAVGVPNATIQGFPVAVAMNKMATLTFGWFLVAGMAYYATTATVAADAAIAISGVGTLGATAVSKGINNCRNRISATGTVAKTAVPTVNNSSVLYLSQGYDGWRLGTALTGTGIPASTLVAKLGPDGNTVYMGSAIGTVDKLATATASVTVTGTYTAFGVGMMMFPFAQGAIT